MTDAHCHVSAGDPSVRELLVGRDFVGVHPWASCSPDVRPAAEVADWLRGRLAADPRLGVGEIGLDRLKARDVSPQMRALFEAQLRVALEFARPVVLHGAKCWGQVVREIKETIERGNCKTCRNPRKAAASEMPPCRRAEVGAHLRCARRGFCKRLNRIIEPGECAASSPSRPSSPSSPASPSSPFRPLSPSCRFLFHGFSRSDGLLPDIAALNGYVSVGPAVLNDHAVNYRALVKKIPLDRLLVETDRDCEPAALPNPLTGAPLSVRDVLAKTAELRGLSPAELEAVTDANAARFLSPPAENML